MTNKYTVELTEEQVRQLGIDVEKQQWHGGYMWMIDGDGSVIQLSKEFVKSRYIDNGRGEFLGHEIGRMWRNQGNIFRTQQEAEAESERRTIMQELRECDGVVEWESGVLTNYISYYYHKDHYPNGKFETVSCDFQKDVNQVYFDTHEHAKAAIEKLGDTKLRKLFRVGG